MLGAVELSLPGSDLEFVPLARWGRVLNRH